MNFKQNQKINQVTEETRLSQVFVGKFLYL